jgi:hypothetical protein
MSDGKRSPIRCRRHFTFDILHSVYRHLIHPKFARRLGSLLCRYWFCEYPWRNWGRVKLSYHFPRRRRTLVSMAWCVSPTYIYPSQLIKHTFPIAGTGIQLIGNATDATYTITLDGIPTQPNSTDLANNVLANFEGLMNTDHTILLTAQTTMTQDTNSFVAFDKASITAPPPAGTPAK